MPIGHIVRNASINPDQLVLILMQEWMGNSTNLDREPVLIEEPTNMGEYKRLYVIWSRWEGISHRERSEIIMRSYQEARGPVNATNVTVATGFTPKEAADRGIHYVLGKNEENE